MGQNWQEIKLGDICDKIGSGATPRGGAEVYTDEGVSLIRSQNVHNSGFQMNGLAHIGEAHARQLAGVTVEPQDILLNITGDSVARTCQVDTSILPARVNQHVAIIRPKKESLIPRYLRYVLVQPSMQQHLLGLASSGATRNALTKQMIEDLTLRLPPLPQQKAIAAVLSSLDDKIELLRKQNETLEKIAQTIFKEWFVEFNFPDKNGKSYKASDGKMIDSELGPIPEEWIVAPFGDYVRCVGGSTPSTSEPAYWDDGSVAFLTPKDMSGLSCPVILQTERYVANPGVQQISSGVLPDSTVVLSSRAPIGYLAITAVPVVINQGIIGMICDGILPLSFVFNWVKLNLDRIKANAGGSTFAEINKSSFRAIKAVIPARDVLSEYSNVTSGFIQKLRVNAQQSAALSQLRDLLLPKLLSGDIRVSDLSI